MGLYKKHTGAHENEFTAHGQAVETEAKEGGFRRAQTRAAVNLRLCASSDTVPSEDAHASSNPYSWGQNAMELTEPTCSECVKTGCHVDGFSSCIEASVSKHII